MHLLLILGLLNLVSISNSQGKNAEDHEAGDYPDIYEDDATTPGQNNDVSVEAAAASGRSERLEAMQMRTQDDLVSRLKWQDYWQKAKKRAKKQMDKKMKEKKKKHEHYNDIGDALKRASKELLNNKINLKIRYETYKSRLNKIAMYVAMKAGRLAVKESVENYQKILTSRGKAAWVDEARNLAKHAVVRAAGDVVVGAVKAAVHTAVENAINQVIGVSAPVSDESSSDESSEVNVGDEIDNDARD